MKKYLMALGSVFFLIVLSFTWGDNAFQGYVFIGLSLVLTWGGLFYWFQSRDIFCEFEKKDYISLIILFILNIAIRFYRLEEKGLWLDEHVTLMTMFNKEGKLLPSIIDYNTIATQSQIGYGYLLNNLGPLFGGLNAIGARLMSILFAGFAASAFYAFIRITLKRYYLTLWATILFSVNPFLFYYSQESRPYVISLFFAICYMAAFYLFCTIKVNKKTNRLLFFNQTLFLFCLSFQPLLIAAGLFISGTTYFYFAKDKRKVTFLYINLATLILYAPYFVYIYMTTKGYISPGVMGSNVEYMMFLFLVAHHRIALLICFFGAVGVYVYQLAIKKEIERKFHIFTSILVGFFIFLILGILMFTFVINYGAKLRYFIDLLPAIYFLFALFSHWVWTEIERLKPVKNKALNVLLISLVFLFTMGFIRDIDLIVNQGSARVGRIDYNGSISWPNLYETIKKVAEPNEAALVINLVDASTNWHIFGFFLDYAYFASPPESFVFNRQEPFEYPQSIEKMYRTSEAVESYILIFTMKFLPLDVRRAVSTFIPLTSQKGEKYEFIRSNIDYIAFKVKGGAEGSDKNLLEMLDTMLPRVPEKNRVNLLMVLIETSLHKGDVDLAKSYFHQFSILKEKYPFSEYFIRQYEYQEYKIHERIK